MTDNTDQPSNETRLRHDKVHHAHIQSKGRRVPEWRVWGSLVDNDGLMLTRLADDALTEQSRMVKIVDQMAETGADNPHTGQQRQAACEGEIDRSGA